MTATVGQAWVELVPSARGFGKRMNAAIGGDVVAAGTKGGDTYSKGFSERARRGLGSAAKGMFAPLVGAAVGLVAFDKAKDFIAGAVDEARESQVVGARTANVIKTMGARAWTSAKQIGNLATALSNKAGIDDEAIQSGENLLLTFGNVRNEAGKGNDIFNQTTKAMVDMSAAMGQDMKGSAIQLGKALNDPTKGLTALSRVGVSFSKQEQDQIKTLQKHGNVLGAQKIILSEVTKQFGGAAAKMATPGQKMSVAWGNLKEQIGTAILPLLDRAEKAISSKVIPAVSRFITQMQRGKGQGGKFAAELKHIGTTIVSVAKFLVQHRKVVAAVLASYVAFRVVLLSVKAAHAVVSAATAIATGVQAAYNTVVALSRSYVATWIGVKALEVGAWAKSAAAAVVSTTATVASTVAQKAAAGASKAWAAAQWLLNVAMEANPIGLIVLAIVALVAGFVIAYKKSETFRKIVNGALHGVATAVKVVVGFIKAHWRTLLAILTGPIGLAVLVITKNWGKIKAGAAAVKAFVVSIFNAMVGFFKSLPGKIGSAVAGMFNGIKNAFRSAIDWVIDKWNGLSFTIPGVDTHIPGVGKVGGFTLSTPDIPRLATGGRATGAQLALIGEGREPETVFPDSVLGGFLERMAAASGGGLPDRVRLVLADGTELDAYFEEIADDRIGAHQHLNDQNRRAG